MHPQALPFGALSPFRAIRRLSARAAATCLGALAIPLWATWPTLAMWSASLPAFEILTIGFIVGWLVLSRLEPAPTERSGGAKTWRDEALPVLACALGLTFTHAFFILATSFIPAAQANLLVYLWPTLLVSFGALSGLFRLRARHGLGLALGFGGAAVVIGTGTLTGSAAGIGLALLSGVCWASYCLFRLWQGAGAANVLARACGVSALLCAGLHVALEPNVVPGPGALVAAIAIGVAPVALANFAWDQGLRRGNSRLLAVMAYGTPVVSALLLIAAGITTATPTLFIGALMIVGAGLVSKGETR